MDSTVYVFAQTEIDMFVYGKGYEVLCPAERHRAAVLPCLCLGRVTQDIGIEVSRSESPPPVSASHQIDIAAVGGASGKGTCTIRDVGTLGPCVVLQVYLVPLVDIPCIEPAPDELSSQACGTYLAMTGPCTVVGIVPLVPRVGRDVIDVYITAEAYATAVEHIDAVADGVGDGADSVPGRHVRQPFPVTGGGSIAPEVLHVARVTVHIPVETQSYVYPVIKDLCYGVHPWLERWCRHRLPRVGVRVVLEQLVGWCPIGCSSSKDISFVVACARCCCGSAFMDVCTWSYRQCDIIGRLACRDEYCGEDCYVVVSYDGMNGYVVSRWLVFSF